MIVRIASVDDEVESVSIVTQCEDDREYVATLIDELYKYIGEETGKEVLKLSPKRNLKTIGKLKAEQLEPWRKKKPCRNSKRKKSS